MMGDEEYNCNGNKKADMVKEALLKEMEELKMQNDRLRYQNKKKVEHLGTLLQQLQSPILKHKPMRGKLSLFH